MSGAEAVLVEGRVEGAIELGGHALTVGRSGKVAASIVARSVVVAGEVRGSITASERVVLEGECTVEGDIAASRLEITDGAEVRGEMAVHERAGGAPVAAPVTGNAPARPD